MKSKILLFIAIMSTIQEYFIMNIIFKSMFGILIKWVSIIVFSVFIILLLIVFVGDNIFIDHRGYRE